MNLWHRLGTQAMELGQLPLARYGFEQGLERSPGHWLCVQKLAAVLYGLDDMHSCSELATVILDKFPRSPLGTLLQKIGSGSSLQPGVF